MKNHDKFYSFAEAYDVAFDFKDIPSECSFLISAFKKYANKEPRSFIDIGAGPALHSIEMSRRGLESVAIDLSKEMVEYGLVKAENAGATIEYLQADMYSFDLSRKFDLAGIFMDSVSYLLTNESVISHLQSVASSLNSRGLYILEMSHPRDVFSVGSSTVNSWEVEKNGLWTSVQWGDEQDIFNPITQITETTVRLTVRKNDQVEQLVEKAPQRCFTCNEFKALVQAEGSFELVDAYGAMKLDVPFTNDKSAWRFIPILQKKN